jgi:tetratricopeptide (TPR) repeat protein
VDREEYDTAERRNEERLLITREMGNVNGVLASYNWLGLIARAKGEYAGAAVWYETGLAFARDAQHTPEMVRNTTDLGMLALAQGEYMNAERYFTMSANLARHAGLAVVDSDAHARAGLAAVAGGAVSRGVAMCQENLDLAQATPQDSAWIASALIWLAYAWCAAGAYKQATSAYHDSLPFVQERGENVLTADALLVAGIIAQAEGRTQRAARCIGMAEVLYTRNWALRSIIYLLVYAQTGTGIRAVLEAASPTGAWEERRALSSEEAIQYLLHDANI